MQSQAHILTLIKKTIRKIPNFEVGDQGSISKYKNIFAKGYFPNWSDEVFTIKKKIKTLCHGHMLLVILMVKKLLECFMIKNCKNKKEFRVGKAINRKGGKPYIKWKGHNNSLVLSIVALIKKI